MDIVSLTVIAGIIGIGYVFRWTWLIAIGALIFVAYIFATAPAPKKAKATKKVKMRPIIVQRKYDEGATIYSGSMEIFTRTKGHQDWWEKMLEVTGTAVGKLFKGGSK
jgi:hypothetical protein